MASERLQKILAQAGLASRRGAEELIADGLVTLNGKVAKLGDKAEWGKDAIKVKGKLLTKKPEILTYVAFHKPKGVISMLGDPEGRANLNDYLEKVKIRVFPIGRLDFNTDGLLLLTNDGDFAQKLLKCDEVPKVYTVKVKGSIDDEMLTRIERGAWIGTDSKKRRVKPYSVRVKQKLASKTQLEVVLMGGGSDLKSLFELRGFLLEKVTRTAIGHITLKGLAPGHFRFLRASQVTALIDQPELGMKLLEKPSKNSSR